MTLTRYRKEPFVCEWAGGSAREAVAWRMAHPS